MENTVVIARYAIPAKVEMDSNGQLVIVADRENRKLDSVVPIKASTAEELSRRVQAASTNCSTHNLAQRQLLISFGVSNSPAEWPYSLMEEIVESVDQGTIHQLFIY